jgi:hypothetical protein
MIVEFKVYKSDIDSIRTFANIIGLKEVSDSLGKNHVDCPMIILTYEYDNDECKYLMIDINNTKIINDYK